MRQYFLPEGRIALSMCRSDIREAKQLARRAVYLRDVGEDEEAGACALKAARLLRRVRPDFSDEELVVTLDYLPDNDDWHLLLLIWMRQR